MSKQRIGLQVGLIVLPILISLALASLLILIVGSNPIEVFETIWAGAFRSSSSLANVVNFWLPITLAGLGLAITFTAGLWNIGVEGQMMIGAVAASWVALRVTLPEPLLLPLELLAAALAGALWAAITGFLKVRLGVNEIFGGVALNALANVLTIFLISGPLQPAIGGSAQGTDPFPASALMPPISNDFPVSLLMVLLVAGAFIVVMLALSGTRWGLHLKATGKNARSALLLGVPTTRSFMTAFLFCGALAGIAGSYRVLFTYGNLRPLASGGIGFLALLVALLVSYRALWIPAIGFVFAALLVGSTRLKILLQLDQSLAGVIQGTIVLLVLLSSGLRERSSEPPSTPMIDLASDVVEVPAIDPAALERRESHE
jgi:simple sugar transport system permease protein